MVIPRAPSDRPNFNYGLVLPSTIQGEELLAGCAISLACAAVVFALQSGWTSTLALVWDNKAATGTNACSM